MQTKGEDRDPDHRQAGRRNERGCRRQPPNPVASVFAAEQARLAARPLPDSVLKPGTMVAETGLLDPYGQPTTMYAALAGRPAVLVSYRGGWCPYCNIALAAYQAQLLPELQRRGVGMVAVSPQKPDESPSLQEKQDLRFKQPPARSHRAGTARAGDSR